MQSTVDQRRDLRPAQFKLVGIARSQSPVNSVDQCRPRSIENEPLNPHMNKTQGRTGSMENELLLLSFDVEQQADVVPSDQSVNGVTPSLGKHWRTTTRYDSGISASDEQCRQLKSNNLNSEYSLSSARATSSIQERRSSATLMIKLPPSERILHTPPYLNPRSSHGREMTAAFEARQRCMKIAEEVLLIIGTIASEQEALHSLTSQSKKMDKALKLNQRVNQSPSKPKAVQVRSGSHSNTSPEDLKKALAITNPKLLVTQHDEARYHDAKSRQKTAERNVAEEHVESIERLRELHAECSSLKLAPDDKSRAGLLVLIDLFLSHSPMSSGA